MELVQEGKYARVIWDSAPAGHTLRLLHLPQLFLKHLEAATKFYLNLYGAFERLTQAARLRKSRRPLLEIIEGWKELSQKVLDFLRDGQHVSLVIITIGEALGVKLTDRIIRDLDAFQVTARHMIVNNLIQNPDCLFHRERQAMQRVYLEQLRQAYGHRMVLDEVFLLATEVKGMERIGKVADILFARDEKKTRPFSGSSKESPARGPQVVAERAQGGEDSANDFRFRSQLITALENERKGISKELHDGLGQTLAATKFNLERKMSEMNQGQAPPGSSLEEILSMIQNAIDENRRIMTRLYPSILDDLGIIPAIHWFCREFQKIYPGMQVQQDIAVQEEEVPNPLKIVLFRVLQEAMNNAAQHGQGNSLRLSLQTKEGGLQFIVQDNGCGFDPEKPRRGLGLAGMKERTELSGGAWAVESAPGKGTVIKATWENNEK
jgi:signal transduction histidine kinase